MTVERCGRRLARLVLLAGLLAAADVSRADPPPPRWSPTDIQELLKVIEESQDEGLRPEDYGLRQLISGLVSGDTELDALADRSGLALAHDFNEGSAPPAQRGDWHVARPAMNYSAWLNDVLANHDIRASFAALLPSSRSYTQLKAGPAAWRATAADCRVFEINLDRWRALPRSFGARYLWVNVAAFRLDLIDGGKIVSSHRIIVGKPTRRTPLFKAEVTGVTFNPWWNVPCSIVNESIGKLIRTRPKEAAKRGYVTSRGSGGALVVRQKPGLQNALGQVKLEMANPYNVYIHDTPTRELFGKDVRAFSHGCVRTDEPVSLAKALLGNGRETEIELLLLTGKTKTLPLPSPVPVYVVYLTAELDPEQGDQLRIHDDVYQRDGRRL